MTKIKVIAGVLDTKELKLYKEDGSLFTIPQGDPRIQPILDQITGPLSSGQPFIEVDVSTIDINHFKEFEEQASGVVKFFRIAKKFVKHIFNPEPEKIEPVSVGMGNLKPTPLAGTKTTSVVVDEDAKGSTAATVRDATPNQKPSTADAVTEIMKNAKSVSDPDYMHSDTKEEETIIAVVDNKVIPEVNKMASHVAHANKMGSSIGIENFLKRVATVIDKRGHSVDDLMKFIERADLPIADDGCIVAWKILYAKDESGTFYDCHTKNVPQRVGSFVFMAEGMVDPNRRNDCSNGLHIARRAYVKSFINSGNTMVMCKIAPEDVIAVPERDANKMRVCAYHILGIIPKDEHMNLINDKVIASSEAKRLLTLAISGKHIGRTENVEIAGHHGTKVTVTKLSNEKSPSLRRVAEADSLAEHEDAPAVDVKKVSQKVTETKVQAKPENAPFPIKAPEKAPEPVTEATTNLPRHILLMNDIRKGVNPKAAAQEILDIKRKSKKSWDKLGISQGTVIMINNLITEAPASAKKTVDKIVEKAKTDAKQTDAKQTAAKELAKVKAQENKSSKPATPHKPKAEPKKKSPPQVVIPVLSQKEIENKIGGFARHEKVKHLLTLMQDKNNPWETQRNAYLTLLNLKKISKTTWQALDVLNFDALQAKFEKK